MKTKIILVLSLFYLFASCGESETVELGESLREVIKECKCPMKIKSIHSNDGSSVALTIQCDKQDDLFPGKVLIKMYSNLERRKVVYNEYKIGYSENKSELNLTQKEMASVTKLSMLFEKDLKLLSGKKYAEFHARIDKDQRKQFPLEQMGQLDEVLVSKYQDFRGFKIVEANGLVLVQFCQSSGNHEIRLVYMLENPTSSIYGCSVS